MKLNKEGTDLPEIKLDEFKNLFDSPKKSLAEPTNVHTLTLSTEKLRSFERKQAENNPFSPRKKQENTNNLRFALKGLYYVDQLTKRKYAKKPFEEWHLFFERMNKNNDGVLDKEEFF